jgi:hypothetical protein
MQRTYYRAFVQRRVDEARAAGRRLVQVEAALARKWGQALVRHR